jgi:DNA-binding transcriptional ArsR family regulator
MVKLRDCGLVTAQVDGKWHRHILRGGSMSAATQLVESNAIAVLGLRLSELAQMIESSETRMAIAAEEDEEPFTIRIAEPGPTEGNDRDSALVRDLGLAGESQRGGDNLARDLMAELCSSHHPITLLALSERMSESRGRVSTVVDRMRAAGLVERAPMVDRISQDVFAGLVRQFDARGEGWLMSRGGLGRLDASVSKALVEGASKGSLDIEGVSGILGAVPLEDQRVLLNTLGGRMPYGFRMAGSDGASVSTKVMRMAERTLRRLRTVAQRLDEAIRYGYEERNR